MEITEAPETDGLDNPNLSPAENRRLDTLLNSGKTSGEAWSIILQERPPQTEDQVKITETAQDPAQTEISKTRQILSEAHENRLARDVTRDAEIAAEQQRKIEDALRGTNGRPDEIA